MRTARTPRLSDNAGACPWPLKAPLALATLPPPHARLQGVYCEQQEKRYDQHGAGDHCCAWVIELLELYHNQQRNNFGIAWHVARNEDNGPVLTDAASEGERGTRHHSRYEWRDDYAAKNLPAWCAQQRGRFFHFLVELFQYRLDRPHHKWQAHKDKRDQHAQRRESDADPDLREEIAQPAIGRVELGEGDAGYRR